MHLWALAMALLALQLNGAISDQVPQYQSQPPQAFQTHPSRLNHHNTNNNNNGSYRPHRVAHSTSNNCDYKELITNLHDRVSVLASLDEDLRTRLDRVEKQMTTFESGNMARLESIAVQQTDLLKRLDSMEYIERMMKRDVAELKSDLIDEKKDQASHSITSRQANRLPTVDDSNKLEALAVFLQSTRLAIENLQRDLDTNITRLSNTVERRFNAIQRQHRMRPQSQSNFYSTNNPNQPLVTSCAQGAVTANGILQLQLTPSSEPFYVRCDDNILGGGWTIIQNRYDGKLNFYRGWLDYKKGFGNLNGEFFIGLDKLHALTSSAVHELIILMQDFSGENRYALYNLFAIGGEEESYALNLLGEYSGDALDSLTYHAGYKFSTFDNDNDGCVDCNCASSHQGAWWYNWCDSSNLNGKYFAENYNATEPYVGMYWDGFRGPTYSLKAVRMMIRPVNSEADSTQNRK